MSGQPAAGVKFSFGPTPSPSTIANLRMLEDGKYSDLKITNSKHTREWKAHRAIVCARCPFFEVCLRNRFKETEENTVDLPEDDPVHINYLLKYLYTFDLDVAGQGLPTTMQPMLEFRSRTVEVYSDSDAFALFALADKFDLAEMKRHWQTALLTKAQNLEVDIKLTTGPTTTEEQQNRRQEKVQKLVSFFNYAYNCENPGIDKIRIAAVETLEKLPATYPTSRLMNHSSSQLIEYLADTIKARPQLGVDLIRALARQKKNQPVLDLLSYQSMLDMLSTDAEVIVQLVNSLALSPS